MVFIPVVTLCAAKDSTKVKHDTLPVQLREPSMNMQEEVYSNEDYNYVEEENKSSSEDGFFDRLLGDLMRSLFEDVDAPDWDPNMPDKPSSSQINWWSLFFIVIGGGLIVFFIIKATNAGGGSLFKGKTKKKEEAIDATLEDVDIHAITYDDEITRAVSRQDYRFAVRLWFLRSLKEMSDLDLIQWKIDKTNSDYYYELSGNKLQKDFGSVSLLYDYVWYGEFKLNEMKYREAERELQSYVSNVKNQSPKK